MTKGVIYASPEDNIQRIADIMKKNDIDSVIVMAEGKGAGIVTDTDIITKVVADGKNPSLISVSDIMTSPIITIPPNADIDDAARVMRDKDIRRLVVVQNNKIIGLLSEFDLVRVEPAMHLLISEHSKWDIADITSSTGTISGICEVCENYSENLRNIDGRMICEECGAQA